MSCGDFILLRCSLSKVYPPSVVSWPQKRTKSRIRVVRVSETLSSGLTLTKTSSRYCCSGKFWVCCGCLVSTAQTCPAAQFRRDQVSVLLLISLTDSKPSHQKRKRR